MLSPTSPLLKVIERACSLFIYICGTLTGSKIGFSCVNTGEITQEEQNNAVPYLAWDLEPKFYLLAVFHRKCSNLSTSIFIISFTAVK